MNSYAIWKYPLLTPMYDKYVAVKMPHRAELLHVAEQEGRLCLWARVDCDAKPVDRRLVVFMTGSMITADETRFQYVGTAQVGQYVWHVFDGGEGT